MASNSTDIANLALALVGENEISDIGDSNERAEICNRFFERAAKEEQRRIGWPELVTISAYSSLSTTAVPGYDNWYETSVPTGLLRVVKPQDVETTEVYRRYQDKWLFLESDPVMAYTTYSSTVADWSEQLVDCVVYNLAAKIAPMLRQDRQAEQLIYQLTNMVRPKAHAESGNDAWGDDRYPGVNVARGSLHRNGGYGRSTWLKVGKR